MAEKENTGNVTVWHEVQFVATVQYGQQRLRWSRGSVRTRPKPSDF